MPYSTNPHVHIFIYISPTASPTSPKAAPAAAVCFGAAPVCDAGLVEAGTLVVSTTEPDVVLITEPEADAKEEATESRMLLADSRL